MDKLDQLEFLYKEIKIAESRLQPHDTGHINTAISWMNHRVSEIKQEIRETQYQNPVGRMDKNSRMPTFSGNPPHKGLV
jgi:hypothetical protein